MQPQDLNAYVSEAGTGIFVYNIEDWGQMYKMYNIDSQLYYYATYYNRINSVTISPDSQILAVASKGGVGEDSRAGSSRVTLWQLKTGQLIGSLTGNSHPVNAISFSPDGSLIVTGSDWKNSVRVWSKE